MNNFNNLYQNPYMMNTWQSPYNPLQNEINRLNQRKQEIDAQLSMLQNQSQQTPVIQNFQFTPQNQQNNEYDFNGSFVEKEEEVNNLVNQTNKPLFLMNKNKNEFYIKNPNGEVQVFNFEQKEKFEKMTQSIQEPQTKETEILSNNNLEELEQKIAKVDENIKSIDENVSSLFGFLKGFENDLAQMGLLYQNVLKTLQEQNKSDYEPPEVIEAQVKEKKFKRGLK